MIMHKGGCSITKRMRSFSILENESIEEKQKEKSVFIFLPERLDDLKKVEAFFPGGSLVSHDYYQEELFITYEFFNSNQGLGKEK